MLASWLWRCRTDYFKCFFYQRIFEAVLFEIIWGGILVHHWRSTWFRLCHALTGGELAVGDLRFWQRAFILDWFPVCFNDFVSLEHICLGGQIDWRQRFMVFCEAWVGYRNILLLFWDVDTSWFLGTGGWAQPWGVVRLAAYESLGSIAAVCGSSQLKAYFYTFRQ